MAARFAEDLTAFDRLWLQGEGVALGEIRLPAQAPAFAEPKALGHHHLVWPRTSMLIRMQGFAPFVASPLAVTLHSPGFAYQREALSAQADHSDYLMITAAWMEELLHGRGPHSRFGRLHFGLAQRGLEGPLYVRAQALFRAVRAGQGAPLAQEQAALELAANTLQQGRPWQPPSSAALARLQRQLAQVALEPGNPSLDELAQRVHASPFHLTRLCRAWSGMSLHQALMALRARQTLLALEGRASLAELAPRLGYRDASHLLRRFRQAFGCSPGQWRAGLRSLG